jgi:N-acyl-D-amino-acid deacylase
MRTRTVVRRDEAVLTGAAGGALGLNGRGVATVGAYADFCDVDTESAIDRASFSEPTLLAARIEHVFVNGRPIWSEGKQTGISPAGRCGDRHSRT